MTLLAPLVGAARGALDVVGSILHRRRPPMTQYDSLAASPGARMRVLSVIRRCQDGVNLLLDLDGASSFAVDNPLQRFWRDLHVGSRHMQFNPYIALENHVGLLADAQVASKPG